MWPVMCPIHICRVRVESESQALRVRVESGSSKIFSSPVKVRVMTWSSQSRVTRIVQSQELSSHFDSLVCKLESMSSHTKFHVFSTTFFAMKYYPTCYKMALDKSENDAQCCFNKFECRLFISVFFSLHFTCLFHSQSFQKFSPTLLLVLQPLS